MAAHIVISFLWSPTFFFILVTLVANLFFKWIESLRDAKEVANVVAQEFISSTYKQCSDCDDDGQKFGSFLMEGQGMALLLVLELYSEQVSK